MSVYLLCKSGFSCDGNDGHEDESPGLPLFLWPVPRVLFDFSRLLSRNENFLFICIHNFVRVGVSVEQN